MSPDLLLCRFTGAGLVLLVIVAIVMWAGGAGAVLPVLWILFRVMILAFALIGGIVLLVIT